MIYVEDMSETTKIIKINMLEKHVVKRKPEIEQECKIAISDLLFDNYFAIPHNIGPYELDLSIIEMKLLIEIQGENMLKNCNISIPINHFRSLVKDYFMICESYFSALSTKDPYRLEMIDMSRRITHNEGAQMFKKSLEQYAEIDFDTARRLFTLMCVLQVR